jgi:alkanesulfonate monooxygenase SsuD/methylene tetrahydromethanopterin reductase-like flavin-dependent oxidoreductase (luciferase family)
MRVGISLTSNYPDVKDPRQGARWMIERAAAAHRAGLDSLFVGDQHVSPTPYYQNTPIRTPRYSGGCLRNGARLRPGACSCSPCGTRCWWLTLAAIAEGPFIMQCGLGWGEARFAAMGLNIKTRPSAFEEALDIVRRLLTGETLSSSRRFRVAEARPRAAPGRARRGLDRRQRTAGHRPRGTTGGGLDSEPPG